MMSAKDEVKIFRMTRIGKRTALTRTTEEYAGQTTIHGINYIFDKKFKLGERVFWLLLSSGGKFDSQKVRLTTLVLFEYLRSREISFELTLAANKIIQNST